MTTRTDPGDRLGGLVRSRPGCPSPTRGTITRRVTADQGMRVSASPLTIWTAGFGTVFTGAPHRPAGAAGLLRDDGDRAWV
jgi:hypothetical protein